MPLALPNPRKTPAVFERELIDSCYVQRWSIVRTLMPQSIAEHTFLVAHYANDIGVFLGITKPLQGRLLQKALWHDAKDEIFTGDLPGPNKRGLLDSIGPDAKKAWGTKLAEWSHRVFFNLVNREGGLSTDPGGEFIELILKTADWLEAATRMATETQMGNKCAERHIVPNMNGAIETAKKLCEMYCGEEAKEGTATWRYFTHLQNMIGNAVFVAQYGQSAGPWITREDENRTYHDPCVDSIEETR